MITRFNFNHFLSTRGRSDKVYESML